MNDDIWIIESVTTRHGDTEEPLETRHYQAYGYFTNEADADSVANMLDSMSGQGYPGPDYDPTGCLRIDNYTTVHFEVVKVSPAPEELDL